MRDNTVAAGFGPRAAAYVIDRALLALALLAVRVPAWISAAFGGGTLTARDVLFGYNGLDILCWALSAVYFVLLTYFTGSTLGKKVLHLQVVSKKSDSLRFVDVLYRETVGRFLSGILFLGYLMVLADRQERAFHDWLCDTAVVYDDGSIRPRRRKAANTAAEGGPAPAGYGYSVPGAGMEETAPPSREELEEICKTRETQTETAPEEPRP